MRDLLLDQLKQITEEEQAMIADGTMQVPSQAELAEQGIGQNTIRLSIGTEHIDDIIAVAGIVGPSCCTVGDL